MPAWLQNPVVVFGLAIGAMFFGYFFGLFEGRGQGYKRRKEEEAEEKEKAAPASDALPPTNPPAPSDEIPVLDVSLNSAGQLQLKLDGQHVDATTMNVEQRKRIIAVLTQMRPWLDAPKSVQSPPPPARPRPAPSPTRVSPSENIAGAKPSPMPTPTSTSDKAKDEPASAPQSIVEQIDLILQTQITGTPLMEKGIRLMESPEGGVIVWVGMNKYQGVEEVPDEEIKAAIRAAISVWEKKYTPGL
jgi:hypothetical protein